MAGQGGRAAGQSRHRAQPPEGGGDHQCAGLSASGGKRQQLDQLLWSYVGGKPLVRQGTGAGQDGAVGPDFKDLSKLGFKFVGSTIIYAYMQGIGMVTTMRRIASAGKRASDDAGGARHGIQWRAFCSVRARRAFALHRGGAIAAACRISMTPFACAWPLNLPGFHRVILGDDVTLDLLVGALDAVLPQVTRARRQFHLRGRAPAMARTLAKLAVQGAVLHARAAARRWCGR
jgi:hypothetical protein